MGNWTKSDDWIPYLNAVKQLIFWKNDLLQIERGLDELQNGGVSVNDPGFQLTLDEIDVSKRGIELAQFKVKRSLKRLTESDKDTWKDKIPS